MLLALLKCNQREGGILLHFGHGESLTYIVYGNIVNVHSLVTVSIFQVPPALS